MRGGSDEVLASTRPDRLALTVPAWLLLAPVAVGAALRILAWGRVRSPPDVWLGDAASYRDLAGALLEGRLRPDLYVWGPGYPLLGALFSFLVEGGAGLVLASLVCGVALPGVVVLAARAGGLRSTGVLAGLILATYPDLVLAAARPLSEAAALLLLAACGICSEAARRTGRLRLSAAAGFLGGFAILTRAELVVAVVPLAALVVLGGRRRARPALAFLVPALLVVGPYALSFRDATGQWGLSLKPHMNVIRTEIHTSASTTLEARSQWDALLRRDLLDGGEFSARKMAAAVDPGAHLLRGETVAGWFRNVGLAARRSAWWERVLWIAGLLGLIVGEAGRSARWVAAILLLPYLTVPLFLPYLGRHMLMATPSLAWGTGALLATGVVRSRGPATKGAAVAAALVLGGLFAHAALRAADELPWEELGLETHRAVADGDLDLARRLATHGVARRPRDPRFHDLLGMVRAESGDPRGAEGAFREGVRLGGSPRNLVMFLVTRGRAEEAEALLEMCPPWLQPAEYWILAAEVAFAAGRWSDEAERLARAEELAGADPALSCWLGSALLRAGRPVEAIAPLTRAAEAADPDLRRQAMGLLKDARRLGGAVGDPPR